MTITAERPVAFSIMTDQPNILNRAAVGALIGVTEKTISEYRLRYSNTVLPFPKPSGYFGRSPYWFASRADEIRAWAAKRPGRGNPIDRQH